MKDYFEILGTQIRFDDIKKYRLVEKEFIFRPVFSEEVFHINNYKQRSLYHFTEMYPYAAIIGEVGGKASLGEYDAKEAVDLPGMGFIQGTLEVLGDKIKPKVFKEKKYICLKTTGRRFHAYLSDVPALIIKENGQVLDVYQKDELYAELGNTAAPAIHTVLALYIKAKEEYLFFGNGIQIDSIESVYEALKSQIESYQEEQAAVQEEKKVKLPKVKLPEIKLPNSRIF